MSRILDLTSETGAYGTHLLAEMGHDVVRIEPPCGDAVRRLAPLIGPEGDPDASAFHQYWNAGKAAWSSTLAAAEGRRLFIELVRRADAVVASLPLPVEEALLREANPRLVLVRLDDGPPEICAYARSGLDGDHRRFRRQPGAHGRPHPALGCRYVSGDRCFGRADGAADDRAGSGRGRIGAAVPERARRADAGRVPVGRRGAGAPRRARRHHPPLPGRWRARTATGW